MVRKLFNPVSKPKHYTNGKFECIDVMEDTFGKEATLSFCKLNAFKYLWRCDKKLNCKEDLQKAAWYIEKAVSLLDTPIPQAFFEKDYLDE